MTNQASGDKQGTEDSRTTPFARALALATLLVSGCAGTLVPGFGERDQYVVNTPRYFDNRVFYLAPEPKDNEWQLQNALQARTSSTDATRIRHGSPLSIILNGVSMPPPELGSDGKPKAQGARDIAVVLDVTTKTSGANESIVAWYQRGVQPDQALNFSNLLIYFDPRWDARLAPLIRIRVVDVTSEKNAEVREALGQVKQFTSSLGPLLPTSSAALVSVASRAAELIVTRPNEQLLDYSVQFFSEEQISESYGSDLTPLKRGRVLLVGRPRDQTSTFWRGFQGTYDGATLTVLNKKDSVNTPVVLISVSTAQVIVPVIVSARSTYLQRLLSDSQQGDVTSVKTAGRAVWDGVQTYVLLENLRRARDTVSIRDIYDAYNETSGKVALGVDDKALLLQALRDISSCQTLLNDTNLKTWWDANRDDFRFMPDKLKLKEEKCPV